MTNSYNFRSFVDFKASETLGKLVENLDLSQTGTEKKVTIGRKTYTVSLVNYVGGSSGFKTQIQVKSSTPQNWVSNIRDFFAHQLFHRFSTRAHQIGALLNSKLQTQINSDNVKKIQANKEIVGQLKNMLKAEPTEDTNKLIAEYLTSLKITPYQYYYLKEEVPTLPLLVQAKGGFNAVDKKTPLVFHQQTTIFIE